ncbi:MAG TPA: BatA domain-containing protein, partial [Pirellulales bacterium]
MFGFENALLAAVGVGLVTLPILIHLINLMRHRRVEWAAMEFLLESRRKNSTYIMLKQLLLLLLRMLAIAAVAMILGRLVLESDVVATGPTHHIVVVDDSFSLGERLPDGGVVFDRSKEAVQDLVSRASQKSRQKVTLWRTSRPSPDVNDRGASSELSLEMRSLLERMKPSQTAAPLGPTLTELQKRLAGGPSEKRIVYVISDFRESNWEAPGEVVDELRKFHVEGAEIVLVNSVDGSKPNLAISDLRLIPGLLAAGVPAQVEVAVKNFGADPARNVSIEIQEDDEVRPQRPQVETIRPGETQTLVFETFFPTAGAHRITAKLALDALEIDNTRRLVVDMPLASPVLLIDGDESNLSEAAAVADVLQPGGTINIGVSPQIEPPSYLMNHEITNFDAIYLFNLKLLPDSSVAKLEKYVKDGGRVCIFAGDQTDAAWTNQKLYRNGEGFFPAPLSAPSDLIVDKLDRAPDLKITEHPVFRFFAGERNSSIEAVSIRRYFAIDPRWKPKNDSGVEVIC